MRLAGELVTCYLFAFGMSYSGKAVHRIAIGKSGGVTIKGKLHFHLTPTTLPPAA